MRRYVRALVVAYSASITLLAARWGMQAWIYRRFCDGLSPRTGRPSANSGLRSLFLDFGISRTPWEDLAARLADRGDSPLLAAVTLVLLACLGVAFLAGRPPAEDPGRPTKSLRWAVRGSLASLALGALTFAVTWACVRCRVLHPNPWPTAVLFVAMPGAMAIGLACGSWAFVRGPGRLRAAAWLLAAPIPLVLWGAIGLYAWVQWGQRLVPNDLPMNLAKMAASSLMSLEASFEYPNRLETDRLVMFYNRLDDPRRDAEAMDRHLARMEGMLGGPLRAKVYWVRGRLLWLDLGSLSVHGIALGGDESPANWDGSGTLDRHELAHAALDEYRPHDADPPYFLHEGWAESQSGVGPVVLARRALEQRAADPSLGVREMASSEWYHRDEGPVYPLGGAFVDFLIRRDGVGKFQRLYNGCRPGTFEATCREVIGADFQVLEAEFWEDVRRQVGGGMDGQPPRPR